jgi:galactose-1-phosphate uridylyltransferase
VIFNPRRAHRPEGYTSPTLSKAARPCPICSGKTTRILDIAELSDGFTFINKNLFPMVVPPTEAIDSPKQDTLSEGKIATGLHFLQWTSSRHDIDWHNMPLSDAVIVLERLASLEKALCQPDEGEPASGYVSIIKNVGDIIGGSLPHGHQQIIYSPIMPRRVREQIHFAKIHGKPFSAHLLEQTPESLILRDYGDVVLLVPYFMRRPYDMMLVIKETRHSHLYTLSQSEMRALAQGWQDATRLTRQALQYMGREIAYNVVVQNGPGTGLHLEFLPYSQEYGGFEQLGLVGCQSEPHAAAEQLRNFLTEE